MRNSRIHRMLAAVVIVLLVGTAECGAQDASCRTCRYDLMSLLVREQYGSEFSLVLIGDETEQWCIKEHLGFLQRKWPGLKSETIDSLIVCNNGMVGSLDERFDIPVEYRLVSYDEYLHVLRGGGEDREGITVRAASPASSGLEAYSAINGALEPDWDSFDRAFPDAQGYLRFSRVGFDSECTQALVIFYNAYRCSGDRVRPRKRNIACFMKEDGAWELLGVTRGIDAMDR